MSMFPFLKKKKTIDVTFKKVEALKERKLENQDRTVTDCSRQQVEEFLQDMFDDADQFVILTVPEARYGVRYVQACLGEKGVRVELGIEEADHIRLVEKVCSKDECLNIFMEFYESAYVWDIKSYCPVEFFV